MAVEKVHIVFKEISDQYGTDEISCVCASLNQAENEANKIRDKRTFIKEYEIIHED